MTLLDYTTVLPRGSAEPDLSGTPDLMSFIDPEMWERRFVIYADPRPELNEEFHALTGAGRRWHAACRAYFRRVEIENGIEFSNWEVSGETGPGGERTLRIATMLAPGPIRQAIRLERSAPHRRGARGKGGIGARLGPDHRHAVLGGAHGRACVAAGHRDGSGGPGRRTVRGAEMGRNGRWTGEKGLFFTDPGKK